MSDDYESKPFIEIRNQGNYLRLTPISLNDYGELIMSIEAGAHGFQAAVKGEFEYSAFVRFRDSLEQMERDLAGAASLDNAQPLKYLLLTGKMDKMGHVEWAVDLSYLREDTAQLTFRIEQDQSYLPAIIADVDAVLENTWGTKK